MLKPETIEERARAIAYSICQHLHVSEERRPWIERYLAFELKAVAAQARAGTLPVEEG